MTTSTKRDVALALEFHEAAQPVATRVTSIAWSAETLEVLQQIRREANTNAKTSGEADFVNLPYGELRARLQLRIPRWIGMHDDLGLRYLEKRGTLPEPWGYVPDGTCDHETLRDVFAEWSEGTLARFCERRSAYIIGIGQLRALCKADRVTSDHTANLQLFPWAPANQRNSPSPFDVTARYLGARLAGLELFPGLGPVARILSGSENNWAELMTRPASAAGGRFSLVCRLSMETLPGASKPLIYVRFIRRRWATTLSTGYVPNNTIGGFVLPHASRPDAAFRFSLSRGRDRSWKTDLAYAELEHHLDLTTDYRNERVADYPCDEQASVVVMLKPEVTEDKGSQLLAGVPLADQGDAFDRIAEALHPLGLRPFAAFDTPKVKPVRAPHLRMIKAEVTLARLLERHDVEDADAAEVEETLAAITAAPAQRWFNSLPQPDHEHDSLTAAIRTLVQATAYANDVDRQTIYLLTDSPEDIEWVRTTVDTMLGSSIKVVTVPLPPHTHGPKETLAASAETKRNRFDARARVWEQFARTCGIPPRSMLLIQAKKFYKDVSNRDVVDDSVNKLAARKVLASQLGCTVQYLLPSQEGRLDKFLPRVQAAVLDLVFGHAGSVWGLPLACNRHFDDPSAAPRWVGAITSMQVSTEWNKKRDVLVATRLECGTGRAWVRFGHAEVATITTPWMRFDEGARYLASRDRLELPKSSDSLRTFFEAFCEDTLNNITSLDPNAVVFVDSTRSARFARWLTDSGIRTSTPAIVPISASRADPWPGLRLIRIRELAPVVARIKSFTTDIDGNERVQVWTSIQRLLHLTDAAAPTYWSLAKPVSHHKRGVSCYRSMLLPRSTKAGATGCSFEAVPPQPDRQHVTPRAIEIVVLKAQPADDPLQLAAFAQHLRAGMLTARNEKWVSTPSPLRIVDKLGDYMKA